MEGGIAKVSPKLSCTAEMHGSFLCQPKDIHLSPGSAHSIPNPEVTGVLNLPAWRGKSDRIVHISMQR